MGEAMAAGLDPLVAFWKEWGIQALVLLSLAVQVILIITAEIRRLKDSDVLRVLVWSAYLPADTTATYALGHMSVTSRSPEHELVAFWAPFLLLHLGGQDNITAYSIEDNRLWLRHLQSFVVQVLAAAYVLYESSIFSGGGPSILRQATILMFVVGVVKYGERVWTVKCASSSILSGKNYQSFGMMLIGDSRDSVSRTPGSYRAHIMLNFSKDLLKGPLPLVAFDWNGCSTWEVMYHVSEIQLSLMHDVFYSKAELIHTWYGWIRVASLPATVTALLLFGRVGEKDSFSRVDVVATYVLLVGAVVLEITSVMRAIFSTWIYQHLIKLRRVCCGFGFGLHHLLDLISRSEKLVSSALRRVGMHKSYNWSGSMGQHNLIYMSSHCQYSRSSKIARWMGREDWWNTLVYTSSSVPVSGDFSQLLKEQVMESSYMDKENPDHIKNSMGRAAMKKRGLYEELSWRVDTELDESILVWHIATNVYLSWYEAKHGSLLHLAKVTQELSNYMMFLLAARTHMLPHNATHQRYIELCNKVIYQLEYSSAENLLRLIRDHGDLIIASCNSRSSIDIEDYIDHQNYEEPEVNVTFDRACQLSTELISKELETHCASMLELISKVWVEILCYAAYRCSPDSHARQLSNGGEIITVVALLINYMELHLINKEGAGS